MHFDDDTPTHFHVDHQMAQRLAEALLQSRDHPIFVTLIDTRGNEMVLDVHQGCDEAVLFAQQPPLDGMDL